MKLSIRGVTLAAAVLWGIAVLLCGAINLFRPSYAGRFLEIVASVYPGFEADGGVGNLVVGTVYALVDGAICGFLFALLYNLFAPSRSE